MYFKIRQHVEDLFKSVEMNEPIIELKEEIITNSSEKYDDLIASGMDEEAAFEKVVSGIGNVNELLGVGDENQSLINEEQKKSALFISIGVGLYILGIIPPILTDVFDSIESIVSGLMFIIWAVATVLVVFGALTKPKGNKIKTAQEKKAILIRSAAIGMYIISIVPIMLLSDSSFEILGIVSMFLIIGIATIILVYQSVSKPKEINEPETVVEEFKQWQDEKSKSPICRTIQTIVWLVALGLYLLISFVFFAWPYSWIIFIIAAIINKIIKLCFDLAE